MNTCNEDDIKVRHRYSVCQCGHFRWQHSRDTGAGRCLAQGCSCKRFKKPEAFDLMTELSRREPMKMR